jgi:hypothetical protein
MKIPISVSTIRVLGFDGWTMGSHHYVRLLDAFRNCGIELCLVHLGSWGDDKNHPSEENINGLVVRDISFYERSDFCSILDVERPDVVLFLSTETFAHRAFQRYCHFRDIPTINLYHGLVGVVPLRSGIQPYKINLIAQIKHVIRQSGKSLLHSFPAYGKSLWKTSASPREWLRFFQDIIYRILGKIIFVPAADAKSTKCCIFTPADFQDTFLKYSYNREDVIAVGNPDLIKYCLSEKLIESFSKVSSYKKIDVMYIDSGISSHGYIFRSDEDYLTYILKCKMQLAASGLNLVFKLKPHPEHRKAFFSVRLSENGVDVAGNDDFVDRLKLCCACITEPSTLGLIPALLGMPLFLVRVGPLARLSFGEVFTSYPRSQFLYEWGDAPTLLNKESLSCDLQKVSAWINCNSGPLPASDMPKRVADVVLQLVRSRRDA